MPSVELLHRLECRACPLNKLEHNLNPHMKPTGSLKPLVYIIGEAPGKSEDERAKQFVGESGQLLRARIPKTFSDRIRWNNIIRCRPPQNRTPEKIEIEACRPSVERDILLTKPKALFGFGNIPLTWAINQSGIIKWRGRRIPVDIAGHLCWFFPFMHPASLLRMRNRYASSPSDIGSEQERAFVFDLKRAFESIEDLPEPYIVSTAEAESNLESIESSASGLKRLEQLLTWASNQNHVGVDYETFGTRPYGNDSRILTAAVGTEKLSFAFPMNHPGACWTDHQRKHVDDLWRKFLLSQVKKCVHTLRFEMEWSGVFYGTDTLRTGPWEDTLNQAMVLDERMRQNSPDCSSLEFLVQQYFGFNLKALSPLNRKDLRKEPLRDVLRYNAMDAKFHDKLWVVQDRRLCEEGLNAVYRADLRKIPTLTLTQIKGVPIYEPANLELQKKYTGRVAEANVKIMSMPEVGKFKELTGEVFSPGSNKDLGILCLRILKRREGSQDGGKYVVDEDILKKIDHPLVAWELKRRKASKRLSTYIMPYARDGGAVWPDGKIHPVLNQPGTISNRSSADEPNTQNIPKRDEEAKEVRKQIRAPKGHLVVSFDYGQIQARGIAMHSCDKRFVKALWEEHDVHADWTDEIAYAYPARVGGRKFLKDWSPHGAMKTFRTDIKNQWTFPAFFGASLESRAEYLNIPLSILLPVERKFWKEFSGILEWHERLLVEYRKQGYVRHLDGRLNRAPLSKNQLFNYPIQGIESHIVIGHAFNTLSERAWREQDLYLQPELEIHDDLTFILPEKRLDDYVETIVTDMLSVPYKYVNVPLMVEVSAGRDLYAMEEILIAASNKWKN